MIEKMLKKEYVILSLLFTVALLLFTPIVSAADKSEKADGECFVFDKKSKYEIAGANPTSSGECLGELIINGDFKKGIGDEGLSCYDAKKDNLSFVYAVDADKLSQADDKWHLCDDSTKEVDGIDLDDKVESGVIIVQTSFDNKKWVTDTIQTNYFADGYDSTKVVYTTKDIQLVNGCYYRIIVAYEQEIVNGKSNILFIKKDDKEYRKVAEVYSFQAVNTSEKEMSDINAKPSMNLGTKIEVKKNTGFSEDQKITINNKDPHYGWDIGSFSVNGFTTNDTKDKGEPIFLKNAGDRVTLWFKLDKNIDNLKGDNKFSIVEDKDGSDQYFEIPKTNFKHGALIIRFTDHEGVKHDPVIYTDYLAANATKGANTKAVLFEEGDYEVALDYTIGESGVFGSENDYRIAFNFSIRNGNTMFFPFDLSTNAELRDNAITPNGFMIDMAKSRYLNINVKRTAIIEGDNKQHSEDVRFNEPAKDGAEYKEEGIYTVDVTNKYTNEHTVKTFYVGSGDFMTALAKSGGKMDVKELDEMLAKGYTIGENGSLIPPEKPDSEEPTSEDKKEDSDEESTTEKQNDLSEDAPKDDDVTTEVQEKQPNQENNKEQSEQNSGSLNIMWVIVLLSVVVVGGIIGFVVIKKNNNTSRKKESEDR